MARCDQSGAKRLGARADEDWCVLDRALQFLQVEAKIPDLRDFDLPPRAPRKAKPRTARVILTELLEALRQSEAEMMIVLVMVTLLFSACTTAPPSHRTPQGMQMLKTAMVSCLDECDEGEAPFYDRRTRECLCHPSQ